MSSRNGGGGYPEERWLAVGAAIDARMAELGLSQTDLVRRSDVSDMTIRPLQYGEPGNYRATTLAKISKALGWPHDGIARILAGEDVATFQVVDVTDEPKQSNGGSASYDERIRSLPATARAMLDSMLEVAEKELGMHRRDDSSKMVATFA